MDGGCIKKLKDGDLPRCLIEMIKDIVAVSQWHGRLLRRGRSSLDGHSSSLGGNIAVILRMGSGRCGILNDHFY